jgi:hypothetical protein
MSERLRVLDGGEREELVKKEVIFECLVLFCMSLYTLCGAKRAYIIFQP